MQLEIAVILYHIGQCMDSKSLNLFLYIVSIQNKNNMCAYVDLIFINTVVWQIFYKRSQGFQLQLCGHPQQTMHSLT